MLNPKGDEDDGDHAEQGEGQVIQRQPDAREDKPQDVANDAQRAGAGEGGEVLWLLEVRA